MVISQWEGEIELTSLVSMGIKFQLCKMNKF